MTSATSAFVQFLGDLNFFLPTTHQHQVITYQLDGNETAKHLIESLGVPHPEVGKIVVHGSPVQFAYRLRTGDNVVVHPWGAHAEHDQPGQLRPPAPRPLRFVLDTHLGQLARYLRLLGFDTLYENDFEDATLASISAEQQRILLTRDRGLLKRKIVVYGHCVRASEPRLQVAAVIQRFRLLPEIECWRRCLRCNGLLQTVAKEAVMPVLEPKTRRYYHEFQRCRECNRIYWRGSHFERMQRFVDDLIARCRS